MEPRRLSRRAFMRRAGLAGVGLTLVAAGCQQQPQVVQATPQVIEKVVEKEVTTFVEITPTPAPALSGSLRLWVFPITENDLDWIWAPLNEKLADKYPEIKLEVELLPWGGRREKMLTAYAGGEAPDLAYVNTDTISLFGQNDCLMPLDDVISAEDWADYGEQVFPGISWDGKRLMVPNGLSVAGRVASKALLEEIGWDVENPPYEWDDVREAAARAKEKGYYYEPQNTTSMVRLVGYVWECGGTMLSEDTTKSLMDQPHGIEAVTFLTEFFRNEWAPLEGAVGSEEEGASGTAVDNFMIGKQVVTYGYPIMTDQIPRQAPDIELVLVPPYKNKEQIMLAEAACWGVFKSTKFPEGASAWINFMIEPENQGFFSSVAMEAPPRRSAEKYWTVSAPVRAHAAMNNPYGGLGWDGNNWWQLQKVVGAPHWQAAALGLKTPEQACKDYAAELDQAIADELAKQS